MPQRSMPTSFDFLAMLTCKPGAEQCSEIAQETLLQTERETELACLSHSSLTPALVERSSFVTQPSSQSENRVKKTTSRAFWKAKNRYKFWMNLFFAPIEVSVNIRHFNVAVLMKTIKQAYWTLDARDKGAIVLAPLTRPLPSPACRL